jgi:hypothetical protein
MNELAKAAQTLRSAVDDLEPKLEGPSLSVAALEDFKATVDGVRTSVLAVLTADNSADPRANLHKFRLRRGEQICRQVLSGLADGTIAHDSPELETLDSTVGEVLDRLKRFEIQEQV